MARSKNGSKGALDAAKKARDGRLTVCFSPEDLIAVRRRAERDDDPPSTWIKKLVRRVLAEDRRTSARA